MDPTQTMAMGSREKSRTELGAQYAPPRRSFKPTHATEST
jgi:hypothetical protein